MPSSGPFIVEADALTSTSIRLTWTDVAERDQNGLILGYKVFYSAIEEDGPQLSILDTEDSATFTVRLTDLKKFTLYRIQILAYTRIGDGVLSEAPAQVRTHEDGETFIHTGRCLGPFLTQSMILTHLCFSLSSSLNH